MDCDSAEKGTSKKQPSAPAEVYLPGRSRALEEDEELVMDKAAYRLYYQLHVEAPCLSFDILLDCLGENRAVEVDGDPVTAYMVSGTQTAHKKPNNLIVMKLSNMKPMTKKETTEKEDNEDSSDSDSDSEDLDSQPELESAKIPHNGTINRVRAHQFNGVYLTATWSELGEVHIWDLSRSLSAVNDSAIMSEYVRTREAPSPLFTFKGHQTEGYALAWSPLAKAQGYLASGDVAGAIHIWQPRPTGWAVSKPYLGHEGSVEDIQWSPTEATVFLSASTDRSLRVWDTRNAKKSAMITLPEAHQSDVNVISWNRLQPVSVVSGADDGCIRVWDLRMVSQQGKSGGDQVTAFTHSFEYHRAAITSVEWHPNEAGIFVATSEDDQTTLWDITLEQEAAAAEAAAAAKMETDDAQADAASEPSEVPVQLLFIHTGQEEVKEAHWHPQIPGLVINTAADGFNVFRTICI